MWDPRRVGSVGRSPGSASMSGVDVSSCNGQCIDLAGDLNAPTASCVDGSWKRTAAEEQLKLMT